MEICLDRAWLNGFTQWDFQIVKKHFPSSHKEAGRVFLLNFTISHFNKHTIVRICLQANTKVGQKTCFLFFFVAFSSILVKEILIWNLNFYSCLHIYILCQKKKKKNYFQTIGWTFENSSELFDCPLGYCIAFQSIQAKLVMNMWESCSGSQKTSYLLLHQCERFNIFLRRAFQALFNNDNDRCIYMKYAQCDWKSCIHLKVLIKLSRKIRFVYMKKIETLYIKHRQREKMIQIEE